MTDIFLTGSINLSKIPKNLIKAVTMKDGTTQLFLNISIGTRKEPVTFGDRTLTHYVSCRPKKEDVQEGVNYFLGDLSEYVRVSSAPSPAEIDAAPSYTAETFGELPF